MHILSFFAINNLALLADELWHLYLCANKDNPIKLILITPHLTMSHSRTAAPNKSNQQPIHQYVLTDVSLCKFYGAGLQCSNIYISTGAFVLQNESCNIENLLLKFNMFWLITLSLQWCHNELDGVSNQQFYECLLMRSCRRRSKKTPKLCVTGIC